MPTTEDGAIGAVITFSREASEAGDPAEIGALLAAAAHEGDATVTGVYLTDDDGLPQLVQLHGARWDEVGSAEFLDAGLADAVLAEHPDLAVRRTRLILSGGRLFGALVQGYAAEPAPLDERVQGGLAEIAGLALDHAHDLRELERTIDALSASRHELARTESLRQLGQMAAVVAHEVKNPIASISGVLQVLRDRSDGPDRAIMEKVLDRLDDMTSLVQELLTFARPREPERQRVDLHALVEDCAEAAQRAEAGLAVTLAGHQCDVDADAAMLRQVFLNLLLNAAQAMDGEGEVHIDCQRVGARVRLRIDDEGPGIPRDQWDQVFEPFFTTRARGTGLGLAVSRRCIESHGGTLELDEAPTGGARFEVTLPVS